jgi:hypothetical protein
MTNIKFPFGNADVQALTADGAQALTITDGLTIIDGVTTEATGNRTLNLTIDDDLPPGAMLFIQNKTNGAETLIFGTGITGATLTGVAGKTFGLLAVYNGTVFIEASTPVQID